MPIYALGDARPELPDDGDFWIAPDAHVIGRVRIGRGVGIWFGAVVRGDNEPIEIGAGSNVQEGALLHTDPGYPLVIGTDVTVGHHAILHGCTVGPSTLVGMRATVLNGARIGRHCLVGAGSLVTERKVFADETLIMGAPAKVVRAIDADAVALIDRSARNYAERARRYARDLRPLERT